MKVLDLFCGAGGASEGLRQAGCDVIGFELDGEAARAHAANGHATIRCDLNVWPWRGSCGLLWGSPPCQPFSSAGLRGGSGDERDGMPAFLRAVEELAPPVVIMENVPGLTNKKHLSYRGGFCNALSRLGYDYQWRILNCADYGVPQTRERFVLIARRDGRRIRWPERTHAKDRSDLPGWVSMAEALGWSEGRVGFARRDDRGDSPDGYRERDLRDVDQPSFHVTGKARSWTLNTGRDWKPGGSRADAQTLDCEEFPAPTVSGKSGGQWQVGPKAVPITVVEAATLQGFPPGYVFVGSNTARFQQIGNAVPPALARALVEAL